MGSLNEVKLIGRAGKDPDCRTLDNGAMVCSLSVATSETWKDKHTGEKKESTEWHNVVVWRGLAEVTSKYVRKGNLLYVSGKLTTRSYEKDGITRYVTEIVANEMLMLGGKTESKAEPVNVAQTAAKAVAAAQGNSTEDLPF